MGSRGGGGGRAKPRGVGWLPDELVIEILYRLRSMRSVVRFQAVKKSWYRFLSDPDVIRHILLFDNQVDSGARILITRRPQEDPEVVGDGCGPTIYSQLCYHTLQPAAAVAPFAELLVSPTIAGCCHGIFCVYGSSNTNNDETILLWNPTTLETKILPQLPCGILTNPQPSSAAATTVGFGFDPITSDYKVVALTRNSTSTASVYTLRKNSWRKPKLYTNNTLPPKITNHDLPVAQSHLAALDHKCYWAIPGDRWLHYDDEDWYFTLASFDMSEERFETVRLRAPGGYADTYFFEYNYLLLLSMVKESLVGVVSVGESYESMHCSYEIWVALDYELGFRCTWIKLFTVSDFPAYASKLFYDVPALWKQGRCFVIGGDEKLRIIDPLQVVEDRYCLAIEAKWYTFQVVSYVPSTTALSSS